MERLSSCYFCGDAVDAAIEEYPLVVTQAYSDIETDERIVLCPSCRRKLTSVIERVLEAALNGEDTPEQLPSVDDDVLVDVDEPSNGRGEPMTATDVEPLDEQAGRDTGAGDDRDADSEADQTAPNGSETDKAATSEAESIDESGSSEDPDEGDGTAWVSAGESGSEDDEQGQEVAGQSEDSSTETTASHSFERGEYNKIVKLLQNREFPVDIEEFTVVAQSAYGIDRGTTHEILDALIERGVIEDKGDRLVRS